MMGNPPRLQEQYLYLCNYVYAEIKSQKAASQIGTSRVRLLVQEDCPSSSFLVNDAFSVTEEKFARFMLPGRQAAAK